MQNNLDGFLVMVFAGCAGENGSLRQVETSGAAEKDPMHQWQPSVQNDTL